MQLKVETTYRQILGMALPISMAMLVPQINFITNTIFLSGLGELELACAGITGVYYLIFAVIGNGLNNGLQALISRRAGQGLPKEIGQFFIHGIGIAIVFAFTGIVVTYTVSPLILSHVIHNAAIADKVISFIHIRVWGLPILYLYVLNNSLLVGTNQTRLIVWGTLSETVANIFFDYSFIYGHFGFKAMGFNGAAYASILAETFGLMMIYLVIHIKKLHEAFFFFEGMKFRMETVKIILTRSSPLIAQYVISIISWEYFYILLEHHGERALAISNTMRNIFGMFGIFAWAFASTANSMVSNIIGQGREDEVVFLIKRITKLSFSFALGVFIILNFIPEWFLTIYGQQQEFVQEAIPVMRIVSFALLLMSVGTVWLNSVAGTGNTVVNLTIEFVTISIYCVYVYFVVEYWNLSIRWGWISEWVYWISMFSMAYYYIQSGKWRRNSAM